MSDDQNPVDDRHAQTHDIARERHTNPKGPDPVDDSFAEQLAEQTPEQVRQQHLDADTGDTDKEVGRLLPDLTADQLARLSVLDPGTPLEQGAVYLNLDDRGSGPYKAIGGQEVGADERIIAKKMTDYELWNEIAGRDDDADVVRP